MIGHTLAMELTNDRIRERMAAKGLLQVDVADALGIIPNKVSLSLGGKRQWKAREVDLLRKLLFEEETKAPALREAPVIGFVAAGNWREAIQQARDTMPVMVPHVSDAAFYLDVTGDSMDLVLPDGGRVLVDPADKALYPGRYYIVQNGEGETTFKRLSDDPLRLTPCSSNKEHKEILIGDEQFLIVGRVHWAGRLL